MPIITCLHLSRQANSNYELLHHPLPTFNVSRLKYTIKGQTSTDSFGTIYEVLSDDNKVYALKELTNTD
jgi:hypothetical protein